jgi:preprotein translocase subunit SecE
MIERLKRFLREVRAEFYKISWPSRMETIGLTVLVISMIVVLTAILFAYDTIFQFVIYGVLLRR